MRLSQLQEWNPAHVSDKGDHHAAHQMHKKGVRVSTKLHPTNIQLAMLENQLLLEELYFLPLRNVCS